MKDRVPTYPGRVKLVPVSGQANTYDMIRADEPVVEGTLLNKANLLPDDTVRELGLPDEANPADVIGRARVASKVPTTLEYGKLGIYEDKFYYGASDNRPKRAGGSTSSPFLKILTGRFI